MVLVDTSVWIDHLRKGNAHLVDLLEGGQVLVHPFVIGELACGSLHNRSEILRLLQQLPGAALADQTEVLYLLETERLYGRGLGWVDVHLLAAARLSAIRIWSLDSALSSAASSLRLAYVH
ncbi:MAG: type II toxin-antitoxin system VapC family toxin [Candidatus Eiseniibacteriota bacterium]